MDLLQEVNDLGEKAFLHSLHRDVIFICGSVGSGKSVLMNYLYGMPMKEFSSDELHLKDYSFDRYVDIDKDCHPILDSNDTPQIRHEGQSSTSIPFIVKREEFVFCECPAFLTVRDAQASLINAVMLRKICYAANTVRIVLLIPFQTILEDREFAISAINDILIGLFENSDCFTKHSSSISIFVTNLPQLFPGQKPFPLSEVQCRLLSSKSETFRLLGNQIPVIFDPLNRQDRLITPVSSVQEILKTLKLIPAIRKPSTILFKVPFSGVACCIQKHGQQLRDDMKTLIEARKYKEASILYKRFMCITVLDKDDTVKIIQQIHSLIQEICDKKVEEIEKQMTIRKVDSAAAILEEYSQIVKAFEVIDQISVLEELKNKYEKNKILKVASFAGAGMVGCAGLGVGVAASIIFPPFAPLGLAVGAAIGGGVAGTGIAAVFATSAYKLGKAFGFTSSLQPRSIDNKKCDS